MKYKISEDLEIKLKKCNNNYPINKQKLLKMEREHRYFKSKEKGCEITIDKKIGFVRLDGAVKVQNGSKM